MDKFLNKYRVPSAKLKEYDYGSNGYYYITICTKNKIHYFGEIQSVETGNCPSLQNNDKQPNNVETHNYASLPTMKFTHIGEIAFNYWKQIPEHFPFTQLDEFVIMPNHIHGIIIINKNSTEFNPNKFGVQSQNIPSIIRAFKSSLKRYANQNNIEFHWQSRYYDHIIRNEKQLANIRNYIINNPLNWKQDELNDS